MSKVKLKSLAAALPVGSVVRTPRKALFKNSMDADLPWGSTAGGSASNETIDSYLAGGAVVMGEGETPLPVVAQPNIVRAKSVTQSTSGQFNMNKLMSKLKSSVPEETKPVVPIVEELILDIPPEEITRPTLAEFSDAPSKDEDFLQLWREARLADDSHLTDEQVFLQKGPCPRKSPHPPHDGWGKFKDLSCPGYGDDLEGLSFGSVVTHIDAKGKVDNWLKVADNGKYTWRTEDGRAHNNTVVTRGIKKGDHHIISWGI
jgi:hypothetical protein